MLEFWIGGLENRTHARNLLSILDSDSIRIAR